MATRKLLLSAFGKNFDLYTTVLNIPKDPRPTSQQIRKAYYKRALKYHPDKQGGGDAQQIEEAKLKFQAISLTYEILSNEESRRAYDQTGEIADDVDDWENSENGVEQWKDFFSNMFGKVTTAEISSFEEKYKFSEEERKDVLKYYKACKGNFKKMLTCVMLSEEVDVERWKKDYIEPAILSGDIDRYHDKTKNGFPEKKNGILVGGNDKNNCGDDCDEETENDDEDDEYEEVEGDDISNEDEGSEDDETEFDGEEDEGEEEDETENEDEKIESTKKRMKKQQKSQKDNASTCEEDEETECDDEDENNSFKVTRSKGGPVKNNEVREATASKKSASKKSAPKKTQQRKEPSESDDLMAKIRGNMLARQGQTISSLVSSLEERYASGKQKQKRKEPYDISDSEFERIQSNLGRKEKSKGKSKKGRGSTR